MALKLMGRKRGMVQLFDDAGNAVPCTAIELSKNVVTQIKTEETDGYTAVQLGFEEVTAKDSRTKEKRTKKPQRGHFLKSGVQPVKNLSESRLEKVEDIQLRVSETDLIGDEFLLISAGKKKKILIKVKK